MEPQIARSEDTAMDASPPNDFNIAQAFPVTDDLVRKVARARRRRQFEELLDRQKLLNRQSLCCAAAALIGFALVAYAFRR